MGHLITIAAALLWVGPAFANPEMTADLAGGATMDFVWIEPGTFMMGSPVTELGRDANEGPQHQVTLTRGFWLGKYEVTQSQWQAVVGTRPWLGQVAAVGPRRPAAYISWNDVEQMLHVLNGAADGGAYRIPTEAEWEYACRAGTATRWSFGDDESQLGRYAWYYGNMAGWGGQVVGTKLPNPWGLYDMHGNVAEWVLDQYGQYVKTPQTDPGAPTIDGFTVDWAIARNGAFLMPSQQTRSAYRGLYVVQPDFRNELVGVRLLKADSDPTAAGSETWGNVKQQAR